MVEVYLEEHMRISRSPTSYQFFTDQSKSLDDQLEVAQGALRDAKNKAGIASIEDRRSAIEGQINAVEVQIHEVGAALAAAEAKLSALGAVICLLPESLLKQMVGGMPNDGLAAMRGQCSSSRSRKRRSARSTPARTPSRRLCTNRFMKSPRR